MDQAGLDHLLWETIGWQEKVPAKKSVGSPKPKPKKSNKPSKGSGKQTGKAVRKPAKGSSSNRKKI